MIYAEIAYVMDVLQRIYPPKTFAPDAQIGESVVGVGGNALGSVPPQFQRGVWKRGGTTAGGADANEGTWGDANYFVGAKYLDLKIGSPQRIVWVPPDEGGESIGPPDMAGGIIDVATDPLDITREIGIRHFRRLATRLVPWSVDMWCHDYDDALELSNWLMAAIHIVAAGNTELAGVRQYGPGGWVRDEHGQRGVRYRLTVTMAMPVVAPYYLEVPMRAAVIRTDFK